MYMCVLVLAQKPARDGAGRDFVTRFARQLGRNCREIVTRFGKDVKRFARISSTFLTFHGVR